MSNPKLKAIELVDKFTFNCRECDNAKQCAIIAVDELIELAKYTDGYYGWVDYYEEVKEEIEKLRKRKKTLK